MVLVDTSVWIQHFRHTEKKLLDLLAGAEVACHAMVLGELACGHLTPRRQLLDDLSLLPTFRTCADAEVLQLIEQRRLHGTGISWIDAHLLASALVEQASLWTLDQRLARQARRLEVAG